MSLFESQEAKDKKTAYEGKEPTKRSVSSRGRKTRTDFALRTLPEMNSTL